MFGEHIEQQSCVNLALIAVTDMTADKILRGCLWELHCTRHLEVSCGKWARFPLLG